MLDSSQHRRTPQCDIIARSLEEDKAAVQEQWYKTFKYNRDDLATTMSKVMLACVARGDFKTRTELHNTSDLSYPSDQFSAVDYLSHASRVIIDYKQLSAAQRDEFLAYFPHQGLGVSARSATHAVIRTEAGVKELKGFMLGVSGQLPWFVKTAYDFGVNIAMGGQGQKNLVGKRISNNGFSGHFYFHHYEPDDLLMLGLEQSAPSAGMMDLVFGQAPETDDVQFGHDQFDQGHSLTGASDVYTAAGSLYFSDPVLQAKCLDTYHSAPPDKYGAMLVTLTDDNWEDVKTYLQQLNQSLENSDLAKAILGQPPSSAIKARADVLSYVSLNFSTYLKRVRQLLDGGDEEVCQQVTAYEAKLIALIQAFQLGAHEHYASIIELVDTITQLNVPSDYKEALDRIKRLFNHQHKIDPKLETQHRQLVIKRTSAELLDNIIQALNKISVVNNFLEVMELNQLETMKPYLEQLNAYQAQLTKAQLALTSGYTSEPLKNSLTSSMLEMASEQDGLEQSWIMKTPVDLRMLGETQETLVAATEFVMTAHSYLVKQLTSAELIELRQLRESISPVIDALDSQLREQKAKTDEQAAQRLDLASQNEELQAAKQLLHQQLQQSQEALAQTRQALSSMRSQYAKSEQRVASFTEQNRQLTIDNQLLKSQLQAQLAATQQAQQTTQAKQREIVNQARHHKEVTSKLSSELELKSAKVTELQAAHQAQVAKIDELQAENQTLTQQADLQTQALQQLTAEHGALKVQMTALLAKDSLYAQYFQPFLESVDADEQHALLMFINNNPYIYKLRGELLAEIDKEIAYLNQYTYDDENQQKRQLLKTAKQTICDTIRTEFLASADKNHPNLTTMHQQIMRNMTNLYMENEALVQESARFSAWMRNFWGLVIGIGVSFGLVFFSTNYRHTWFGNHSSKTLSFATRYFDTHVKTEQLIPINCTV